MQLLVSWIIDHPNAVAEEEVICICSFLSQLLASDSAQTATLLHIHTPTFICTHRRRLMSPEMQ